MSRRWTIVGALVACEFPAARAAAQGAALAD